MWFDRRLMVFVVKCPLRLNVLTLTFTGRGPQPEVVQIMLDWSHNSDLAGRLQQYSPCFVVLIDLPSRLQRFNDSKRCIVVSSR